MERHSFAMEIKKGKKNEYRQILGEIWPDLTAFLDQEKVHNFSIWNCDSLIFGYYETDENNEFSEEKKASIQALTSRIDHTFTWISTPGENMRLMYHNFGVVRENKELIRHRMFMTRLKPDCEEELGRAFREAGAHYVISSIVDLPALVDVINARLARGERP